MFLNPAILIAGLLAVGIPIVIHLLMRRRREPVMWGAMRFVLEAYRATRRRLLLERWLLLAARCLLVAAVAIALGRPILSSLASSGERGRVVYLVIDDSLTAGVSRGGVTSLERSKRAALQLIDTLGDADRVALVTMAQPVQALVAPPSSDKAAVRSLVEGLAGTDARADVAGALGVVAQQLGGGEGARGGVTEAAGVTLVALLSDWLEGSTDLQVALPKLPAGVRLAASMPGAGVNQAGITRLAPLREVLVAGDTGATQTVTIWLSRTGGDEAGTTGVDVSLESESGSVIGRPQRASVNWSRGERTASATIALEIDPTTMTGPAVLTARLGDDALTRDNVWRLPLDARPTVRVGLIAERLRSESAGGANLSPAQWLTLALRPLPQQPVEINELDPATLDGSRLTGLDAVFVLAPQRVDQAGWSRLGTFARAGGLVVITPAAELDVHGWSDAMTAGLELGWQLPRTARVIDPADPRRARVMATAPTNLQPADDLLAAVRGELPELAGSVSVVKVLPPVGPRGGMTPLLTLDDGTALLVSSRPTGGTGGAARGEGEESSRGAVVYLAVALDLGWTDLPAKPLMVPLMQEVLRQGLSRARPALWTTAGQAPRLPSGTVALAPAGEGKPIAASRGTVTLRSAGVWRAIDALGASRGLVAANPDALGERTGEVGVGPVSAWLAGVLPAGAEPLSWLRGADGASTGDVATRTASELLSTTLGGTPSSSWWLSAAVMLALVELWLARRVSHAAVGGGAREGVASA